MYLTCHVLQATALGRAGQVELVMELIVQMKGEGGVLSEVAYKAAVECCAKVSQWPRLVTRSHHGAN